MIKKIILYIVLFTSLQKTNCSYKIALSTGIASAATFLSYQYHKNNISSSINLTRTGDNSEEFNNQNTAPIDPSELGPEFMQQHKRTMLIKMASTFLISYLATTFGITIFYKQPLNRFW